MGRDLLLLNISPPSTNGEVLGERLIAESLPHSGLDLSADGLDFQIFAARATELARILTGASGSAIAFREEQGTVCRARSGHGAPRIGAVVDATSGISRQCLDSGTALFCQDTATDSRIDAMAARDLGIRAVAVVPIFSNGEDGETCGILEVFSRTPGIFTDRHLKTLHHLAVLIGSAANPRVEQRAPASNLVAPPNGHPDLALLIEREPAYRVFFRNLAIVTSLRSGRSRTGAYAYAPGWRYVAIDPRLPWSRFFQSIFVHVMVLGMVAGLARIWPRGISLQPRRHEHITYYPFSGAAPVLQATREPEHSSPPRASARRRTSRPSRASSPEVASSANPANSGPDSGPPSPPPALQGAPLRQPHLPVAIVVVAPAPDVTTPDSRRLEAPSVTVVAPPPDLGGKSGSRTLNEPTARVIPPSPEASGPMKRAELTSAGILGSGIVPPPPAIDHADITYAASGAGSSRPGVQVIAPPPSLQGSAAFDRQTTISLGRGGSRVVPPPPSMQGAGSQLGGGRTPSLAVSGSRVVPPPPSMQGLGNAQGGQIASLERGGGRVVPPPPSTNGMGSDSRGGVGSLSGSGTQVVPPPPSLGGMGGGGRGRIGAMARGGSQVVPPPPSLGGTGNGTGTHVGSIAGGTQVVPPPPSLQGGAGGRSLQGGGANRLASMGSQPVPPSPSAGSGGNSLGGGMAGSRLSSGSGAGSPPASARGEDRTEAADARSIKDVRPRSIPPVADKQMQPTFQNVQLRVIVSAFAPPRSSYFSNYEVFIAQKWLNKETPQLIKLVYVFLPYQRRLSEYGADSWKVRKLRVTRDPSCDESLMQLEWPEGENGPSSKPPDRDNPLPCYRTTADDYRRAVSGSR